MCVMCLIVNSPNIKKVTKSNLKSALAAGGFGGKSIKTFAPLILKRHNFCVFYSISFKFSRGVTDTIVMRTPLKKFKIFM